MKKLLPVVLLLFGYTSYADVLLHCVAEEKKGEAYIEGEWIFDTPATPESWIVNFTNGYANLVFEIHPELPLTCNKHDSLPGVWCTSEFGLAFHYIPETRIFIYIASALPYVTAFEMGTCEDF